MSIIHTAPLGNPPAWSLVMDRCAGQCECTGSCGRKHDPCGRGTTRPTVAPADLALSPVEAAHVPVSGLRAWCPDCHRLARRRHAQAAVRRAQHGNEPTPTLF